MMRCLGGCSSSQEVSWEWELRSSEGGTGSLDGTERKGFTNNRQTVLDFFFVIAFFLLSPFLLGFGPPTLVESDDVKLPVGKIQLGLLAGAQAPPQLALATVIMDLGTGRVVFQRNANARLPEASITKIMTAIVVMENADLSARVSIVKEDMVEGSAMGIQPGDSFTVEQLLWGLLVPSGNDAAVALARHVGGGSVGRFVEMMNQKAKELRLGNTNFANPHGLHAVNNYSSAYDIAVMSYYALKYPLFAKIVSTGEYDIQSPRVLKLQTSNQLLSMTADVPGVTGVKTGYTEEALDCLVASVDRGGRKILTVALGSMNRVSATRSLIDYAYKNFSWAPLSAPFSLRGNPSGQLAPAPQTQVMLPSWQAGFVGYAVDVGRIPQDTAIASPVGIVTYYLDRQELTRVPLHVQHR